MKIFSTYSGGRPLRHGVNRDENASDPQAYCGKRSFQGECHEGDAGEVDCPRCVAKMGGKDTVSTTWFGK